MQIGEHRTSRVCPRLVPVLGQQLPPEGVSAAVRSSPAPRSRGSRSNASTSVPTSPAEREHPVLERESLAPSTRRAACTAWWSCSAPRKPRSGQSSSITCSRCRRRFGSSASTLTSVRALRSRQARSSTLTPSTTTAKPPSSRTLTITRVVSPSDQAPASDADELVALVGKSSSPSGASTPEDSTSRTAPSLADLVGGLKPLVEQALSEDVVEVLAFVVADCDPPASDLALRRRDGGCPATVLGGLDDQGRSTLHTSPRTRERRIPPRSPARLTNLNLADAFLADRDSRVSRK